jgi:glycine reductase
VQITAIPNIAEMLGVNRVVVGEAVPHPVGNPKLDAKKEKELRRRYIEKALGLLQQDVTEPRIVKLD